MECSRGRCVAVGEVLRVLLVALLQLVVVLSVDMEPLGFKLQLVLAPVLDETHAHMIWATIGALASRRNG